MDVKNMSLIRKFKKDYLSGYKTLSVLDAGSKDEMCHHDDLVFRKYFQEDGWNYLGVDIVPGKNVDQVVEPYNYPFPDRHFDVVICASVLEHTEDVYALIKELVRLTNKYLVIIVPWDRPTHNYPVDCWRISPTALKFLINKYNMKTLESDFVGRDSFIVAEKL